MLNIHLESQIKVTWTQCFQQPTSTNTTALCSICLMLALGGKKRWKEICWLPPGQIVWYGRTTGVVYWPSLSAADASVIRSGNDPWCCERRKTHVFQVATPGLWCLRTYFQGQEFAGLKLKKLRKCFVCRRTLPLKYFTHSVNWMFFLLFPWLLMLRFL